MSAHRIAWLDFCADAVRLGLEAQSVIGLRVVKAAFGGPACAQFLGNGAILANTQTLKAVTKAETADARAQLNSIMSSGN